MCGQKICIPDGTYQEALNTWCNRLLRYIRNNENSLTRGSVQQFNTENIFPIYIDVVLLDGELIHPRAKDASFASMCEFPENNIKFPKW